MGKIKIPKSRVQKVDKELQRAKSANFTARLDDDLLDRYQNLRKDQQDEVLRQAYRYKFTPFLGLAGNPTERPSFQARMRKVITDLENERVQPSVRSNIARSKSRSAQRTGGAQGTVKTTPKTTSSTPTTANSTAVTTATPRQASQPATTAGTTPTYKPTTRATTRSQGRSLQNTPAAAQQKATTYTIKKGDTLGTIAKRYGVDWRALAEANGIDDPNLIYAGVKLKIDPATMGKKNRRKVSVNNPKAPGMDLGEKKFSIPTRKEALGSTTNMPMSTGALNIDLPEDYY